MASKNALAACLRRPLRDDLQTSIGSLLPVMTQSRNSATQSRRRRQNVDAGDGDLIRHLRLHPGPTIAYD